MASAFLLALREGLEAALIVGVVLGALRKLDYGRHARYVWLGVGAAILVSAAAGVVLSVVGAEFEGRAEQVYEGIMMLLAALILTWMIVWMMTSGRLIQSRLAGQVSQSVATAHRWGLFWLALVAVVREGLELALFLTASALASSVAQTVVGTLVGLAGAVALGWGVWKATVRLDLGRFFRVTGLLLVLVAAGLVAHSIHELNEAGLVPVVIEHVWDVNWILSDQSVVGQFLGALVGYNGNPSLTEVAGYMVYLALAGILLWRAQLARHIERQVA